MKTIIFLIAVIGLSAGFINYAFGQPLTCPDGSYQIDTTNKGAAICKQLPTGCQYGDSIALDDCEKFEEPQQQLEVEPEPAVKVETGFTSITSQNGK